MRFESKEHLPPLIKERLSLEMLSDVWGQLEQIITLSDEQRSKFYALLDSVILSVQDKSELAAHLKANLAIDDEHAQKAALFLWIYYFSLFQDLIGSVENLIKEHNGDVLQMQEHVRLSLAPSKFLMPFFDSLIDDWATSEISEEVKLELIIPLLSLASEKITPEQCKEQLERWKTSRALTDDIQQLLDLFQYHIDIGEMSKEKADYYLLLSDSVLAAQKHPLLQKQINAKTEMNVAAPPKEDEQPSKKDEINLASLPDTIRQHFSSDEFNTKISEFEKRNNVFVKSIILRAAIKEIQLENFTLLLNKELHLGPERASELRDEIIKTFFEPVMWYYTGAPKGDAPAAATETSTISETKNVLPVPQATSEQNPQMISSPHISQRPVQPPKEPLRARSCESYEALADEIIEQLGVQCDQDGMRRIRAVLVTRVRNIRTNIETQERLIEEGSKGGCSIVPDIANALTIQAATLAEGVQKGLIRVGKVEVVPESQMAKEEEVTPKPEEKKEITIESMAQADEPLKTEAPLIVKTQAPDYIPLVEEKSSQLQPKPEPTKPPSPSSMSMAKPPLPLIKPTAQPRVEVAPKLEEQRQTTANKLAIEEIDGIPMLVDKSSMQAPKPTGQSTKQDITPLKVEVRSTPPATAKAISVTDVKKMPHLVGPIDELQSMSLKDFRRMSADASAAARRIRDKIQTLEKESLPKKMEAIEAWKRSEVNQLYIEIGKESFGKGVPIAQAIQQRKSAGLPYLEESEFDALLDLNTMLRH